MKPLIAIVGRPNVGKSTLFNRLVGHRRAFVEDTPGVTRDRNYANADLDGRTVTVIDTGGFVPGEEDPLLSAVREQAQLAVEECDVIVFVLDGRVGLTGADQEVAKDLRRSGKPVIVVANKLDSYQHESTSPWTELHRLGLGDPIPLSAEHGRNSEALVDRLMPLLPEEVEEPPASPDAPPRVAIIGRPNVGKSTMINALLKKKRLVASPIPGTTRDPIDSELNVRGRRVILTDTAGIRRKKSIAQRLEHFAAMAALKVVDKSDVAVLLMDATEPAVDQDAKLAGLVEEAGKALVIVVNKWDLIDDPRKQEALRADLKHQLKFVAYAPILFTSALTGARLEKVLEVALQLHDELHFRAPTSPLNRLLEHALSEHPAPFHQGKPLRLYYVAQVGTAPPAFAFTCNRPQGIPERFQRYLSNQLRSAFSLRVPLRLFFRERPGKAKRAARRNPQKMKGQKMKGKRRKSS